MSCDQWVIDVERDLEAGRLDGDDVGSVGMPPICRVPAKVREMNEKAYQPEVVSIGPYHHGEERLQAMETHKRRALLHFLRRSNRNPKASLDLLREFLPEIRAAYDNLDGIWKDDDELFLKMMLMDGCFILELLFTSQGTVKDYNEVDPIFGLQGRFYNVPSITRDLLLIENQIPFLVLRILFVYSGAKMKAKGYEDIGDLLGFLLEFLPECSLLDIADGQRWIFGGELWWSLHILDLYRRRMIFGVFAREERNDYNLMKFSAFIPSAMALQDHGILLRRVRVSLLGKLLSASFLGRSLDLPKLTVDDTTESVFLNAMVFESLQNPAADARFTSYVSLMSNLIVSPRDAHLLSTELGIIRNELRSNQALVNLFSNLSSANFLPDRQLFKLQVSINEHCRRRRNRRLAYLNRTYFRSPWAIPVFYAIIILVLTAIQAFYTIFPNNKP